MPRAKSNKPMGRPKFEVTEEVLENVKKYMAQGLTKDQCAGVIGISPATFYILQEQYSEFSESIKRGQAEGIQQVTNALFEKATQDRDNVAMIFYLKEPRRLGG
jgi:hypothetical protein